MQSLSRLNKDGDESLTKTAMRKLLFVYACVLIVCIILLAYTAGSTVIDMVTENDYGPLLYGYAALFLGCLYLFKYIYKHRFALLKW